MNKITLVINRICPFAERSLIALLEKEVDFEIREVSLKEKEQFFTATYRQGYASDPKSDGKVPILIDGDFILCESDLIVEYCQKKFQEQGTRLHPEDPLHYVKMRIFINQASRLIGDFYSFMKWVQKTQEQKNERMKNLQKSLQVINDQLVLPYAVGQHFSQADLMIYPWIIRLVVHEELFGIKIDNSLTNLHEWISHMENRSSIKNVRRPHKFYVQGYNGYF